MSSHKCTDYSLMVLIFRKKKIKNLTLHRNRKQDNLDYLRVSLYAVITSENPSPCLLHGSVTYFKVTK